MAEQQLPVVTIVIPCYNEQLALPITADCLKKVVMQLIDKQKISNDSRIFLIDDGSIDETWEIIKSLAESDELFSGLKLTRNFGHQYALYAGLMESDGDVTISIDADMQDDLSVLGEMIDAYMDGNEIVFGVREDRSTDSVFKRVTASLHYWLTEKIGIETVKNHADFRLLSHRAVEILRQYGESNLYLRGIVPLIGLPSTSVFYAREERIEGKSKYNFRKMVGLSVNGLTSFSIMPLRIVAALGILVFFLSMAMGGWVLASVLWGDGVVPGWASTVIPIYLLGGLQLFGMGVVGEYIGKTYIEVKKRPRYLVQEKIGSYSRFSGDSE